MRKNPDPLRPPRAPAPADAAALRDELAAFAGRLLDARAPLHVAPADEPRPQSDGHFHLAPELFLQVSGTTVFTFPSGAHVLGAGEALLLPPRLQHDERVRAGRRGEPFRNLVIQADGPRLSCHLAHEAAPGRPGIRHLEARRDNAARRVHDWLADAARLGAMPGDPWAAAQARGLVAAAAAAVRRTLDDAGADAAPAEPPLVARLRVHVQNQLGDHRLSVRGLAALTGCTPDHLSHVFGRTTGEHLVAYITRLRMERAARLLRETTMAGKAVAWACGYASPSYFVRCFRAHHGTTPGAWRAAAAGR